MIDDSNMEEFEFRKVDILTLSREDWNLYHEFRRKRHQEFAPEDPYVTNEAYEKSLRVQATSPEFLVNFFFIFEKLNGKMVGRFAFITIRETNPSYKNNKNLLQLDVALLSEYRRKGIGTEVMKKLYEFAEENNKSLIMADSSEEDGKAFLQAMGAQIALSGMENRLNLEQVDWNMVKTWIKEGPKRSPESVLHFVDSIPEDIIEKYCEVYTETLNQQPFGDLEIGAIIYSPEIFVDRAKRWLSLGYTHLTMYTQEENGDISGLTEMLYNPSRETFIQQLLTGVQKTYRGRGLGKWLKAEMLLKTKEMFPKVRTVTTGNATTNAPMISINDRLGFKPHKESITAQIHLEKLGEYLKKK